MPYTNQSQSRSRRGKSKLIPTLCVIIILIVIVILGKQFIYEPLKEEAVSAIAEKLIQTQISADTTLPDGTVVNAQEILDSMTPEDKEAIQDIVTEHISPSTISEASSYIASGDTEGLKNYAKEMLSAEEISQVKELYSKYKDQIPASLQ